MEIQPRPSNPCQSIFEALEGEGFLHAIASIIVQQCQPDLSRPPRHSRPQIRNRNRGIERWDDVDDHCADVGDRFGFKDIFQPTGRSKQPEMMALYRERDELVVMFHKTGSPWQAKSGPVYVSRAVKESRNTLFPEEQIEEEAPVELNLEGKTLIQITYGFKRGDKLKEQPEWITFGIPNGATSGFYFKRALLDLYPELRGQIGQIDFNSQPPARTFVAPAIGKGEGDDI
jgi:hypothetical protein